MYQNKYLIFCIAVLISIPLSSQSVSEKRSFMRSVPVQKDSRLEVVNRYGNIHITTWNKDSAYITAEVEAFAPNRARLEKLMSGVSIDIDLNGSLVSARTEFTKSLMTLHESIKGLTDKIIDYDARVQINYYINVPDYIEIRIDNQFGDVQLENNRNRVSATVSNGRFDATSLNDLSQLTLNLGDAEIGTLTSGSINSSFSELVLGTAGELSVNSTSSRFEIKNTDKINVESRRDKFFIGAAGEINGTSYFTDYHFGILEKVINLSLKYGSLDADKIYSLFEKININSSYSDINLSFDQSSSYSFEIRHTNAFVVIPDKNVKSGKDVINEDKREYMTSGTFGNNPGQRKVRIDASRGNIYLK